MEKGYLCEKRCPFFVPGYRYADKGQGGKKHEKQNCKSTGIGNDCSNSYNDGICKHLRF